MAVAGCHRAQEPPTADGSASAVPAPATSETRDGSGQPIRLVSGDDSPWKPRVPHGDWKYLVIHHSASEAGSVESIHRLHLQRRDADGNPWRGVGYHFVIGNGRGMPDGAIEPTFRWREQLIGAHAGLAVYNQHGIGICLVGNFEKTPPTPTQIRSLKRVVSYLTEEYGISADHVVRHRDIKATVCPGKQLPMQEIIEASFPASTSFIYSQIRPR
jgi:hypothetical protein